MELQYTIAQGASNVIEFSVTQIALIILGAIVIQWIINRYIGRIITKVVKSHKYESRKVERQREQTLISILRTASAVVIWVIALLLILAALNVNIAALATGAGLIGVVVGFGAQNTIKDFLAGLFIIAENQYRVGDIITISGRSGVVESISIRITRLRDLDGQLHIVPNGQIDVVTNMTFEFANANVDVGVSYDSDIDKVARIVNDVGKKMAGDKDWEKSIIEPIEFLRVDNFGDSAITIKALGRVVPGMQWDVTGEFRRRLKIAFDQNGIEIPFPQRVLHMIPEQKSAPKK